MLPDTASAVHLFEQFSTDELDVVPHRSGRPWIVGNWQNQKPKAIETKNGRVCLIGDYCFAQDQTEERLKYCPHEDYGRIISNISGCFHFIASTNGNVLASAPISGVLRLFYSRVYDVNIASNSSLLLSKLNNSTINLRTIATKLLSPAPPFHIENKSVWNGIKSLNEANWLHLDGSGVVRETKRWNRPEASISVVEGGNQLRQELSNAIGCRVTGIEMVSSDLSGGLDSTPICFIANQLTDNLLLFTAGTKNSLDSDFRWANYAAAQLPECKHEIVLSEQFPTPYSKIDDFSCPDLDEPFHGMPMWHRIAFTAERLKQRGSTTHFSGHGGDEVLLPPVEHLFEIGSKNVLKQILALLKYRSISRWSLPFIIRRWF